MKLSYSIIVVMTLFLLVVPLGLAYDERPCGVGETAIQMLFDRNGDGVFSGSTEVYDNWGCSSGSSQSCFWWDSSSGVTWASEGLMGSGNEDDLCYANKFWQCKLASRCDNHGDFWCAGPEAFPLTAYTWVDKGTSWDGTNWVSESSWLATPPNDIMACCAPNRCVSHGGASTPNTFCEDDGRIYYTTPGESNVCSDGHSYLCGDEPDSPVGTIKEGSCCAGDQGDGDWYYPISSAPKEDSHLIFIKCQDGVDNDCDGDTDCDDSDCWGESWAASGSWPAGSCASGCSATPGCRSSAPPYSHVESGSCSTGTCYQCNTGYSWTGTTCQINCDETPGCRSAAPSHSTVVSEYCSSGTCYRCDSGYIWNGANCVVGDTDPYFSPLLPNQNLPKNGGFRDDLFDLDYYGRDAQGDSIDFTITSQSNTGIVSCVIDTANRIDCTVVAGVSGYSDVTVRVYEIAEPTDDSTDTFRVTISNTAPVANAQTTTNSYYGVAKSITVSGSDANGDTLAFWRLANPSFGTLTDNDGDTLLIYTPTTKSTPDSFTFRANDGEVYSAAATVSIPVRWCGDGGVNPWYGEECDPPGSLGGLCLSDCTLCTSYFNGVIECGEVCDPGNATASENLDGETCQTQGFDCGALHCLADGSGYDLTGCVNEVCGNAVQECSEGCDYGTSADPRMGVCGQSNVICEAPGQPNECQECALNRFYDVGLGVCWAD